MNQANGRSANGTMDRAIRAYAEQSETWKMDHDEVQNLWLLEDSMITGRSLFSGLGELAARLQSFHAGRPSDYVSSIDVDIKMLFAMWQQTSESILAFAEMFTSRGHKINGYDEFLCALMEGRAALGNLELGDRMPLLEEMRVFVRSENPNPTRYEN